jgi:tRNA (guanine-N7-)-methyltransferase
MQNSTSLFYSVVQFVDVGCGFGGLTVALSELYPNKIVLGLEIRSKVYEVIAL